MTDLTEFLDKYGVKYTINGDTVEVGGGLSLDYNQLTSLPESFGNLKVGGGLSLDYNQLTSLPESFGNLKVGGNLSIYNNQLTSLPESFGNLKVGGGLSLDYNQLTSLPESFGNLKVGGGLSIYNNQLTSLPESFGNLKVGGGLSLDYNQLKEIPTIPRMTLTVERDWCFIDGIVREIVSKKKAGELTIIKTHFDFIVGNGEVWAHGKTIKDATEDYQFKLMSVDPESIKDIDLDKPMSHVEAINVYRAVTRSCREGVRQWMSGKTFPEPITVRQIIGMTGDAYGGSEFAKFFEVSK
jgi:hypothetical protein